MLSKLLRLLAYSCLPGWAGSAAAVDGTWHPRVGGRCYPAFALQQAGCHYSFCSSI